MNLLTSDLLNKFISSTITTFIAEHDMTTGNFAAINYDRFRTRLDEDLVARNVGEAGERPARKLKAELSELFGELKRILINEIRSTIKDELRSEIFLELKSMKESMGFSVETPPIRNSEDGTRTTVRPNISDYNPFMDVESNDSQTRDMFDEWEEYMMAARSAQ
jgi:hypothetical protein